MTSKGLLVERRSQRRSAPAPLTVAGPGHDRIPAAPVAATP